jgi:hypothetical protein
MRPWQSKLRVIDYAYPVSGRVAPVFRPATFWEKVRYWLGLPHKGPKYIDLKPGERVVRHD